ncbi:SdpI family protein [Mucilaginibacter defluvii]|uniref:SdpI/YhfL family protein n=1 Tax=Mucilaginibacter defluvii TaxID=1196019 RepID=A0ABP9G6L1_9SPHI
MDLLSWIIGPQLIGIIFTLAGYIQKRFPPKKINALYGYRMPSSMKNQETWDEANHYAARFMMRSGFMLLLVGIVTTAVLCAVNLEHETFMFVNSILLIPSAIGFCVALIVSTEKHLSRKFDNKP